MGMDVNGKNEGHPDMRRGVLGGTFDPIHNGHLKIAEEAACGLDLDEVIFVPAAKPPLRPGGAVAEARHRLRMVCLAIDSIPKYKISTVEMDREGPSYTVDTIEELRQSLGGEIYFILGWDSLEEIPKWHDPLRLVTMCHLVAVPRPGYPKPDLNKIETLVPGLIKSTMVLEGPLINISASDIRSRIARGLSIGHLVPRAVADYIKERGLYTRSS
jgi:nicotinate-nucleotide adenylyltransferase